MPETGIRLKASKPLGLELGRGRVVWVCDDAGVELVCHCGTLWVTDGSVNDVVLHPGDRLAIDRQGCALVHAMHDARLTVRPATPAASSVQRRGGVAGTVPALRTP